MSCTRVRSSRSRLRAAAGGRRREVRATQLAKAHNIPSYISQWLTAESPAPPARSFLAAMSSRKGGGKTKAPAKAEEKPTSLYQAKKRTFSIGG